MIFSRYFEAHRYHQTTILFKENRAITLTNLKTNSSHFFFFFQHMNLKKKFFYTWREKFSVQKINTTLLSWDMKE